MMRLIKLRKYNHVLCFRHHCDTHGRKHRSKNFILLLTLSFQGINIYAKATTLRGHT